MFVAHLPAGYLWTAYVLKRRAIADHEQGRMPLAAYWCLGLMGSILPDFDLLYFYFIDLRQHNHHTYWTHIPIYWLLITVVGHAATRRRPALNLALWVVVSNVWLHLLLDSVVGRILWLYPYNDSAVALFDVPARYEHWILNFALHWTFLFEVALILAAAHFYLARRRPL